MKATRVPEVHEICCFCNIAISSCFNTVSSRAVEPAVLDGFMHVERCARCGWAAGKTVFSRPPLQVRAVRSGQREWPKKRYPQGMMKRTGLLPHSDCNRNHQVLLLTFRHDARTQEPVTSVPVRNRYSIGPTFPSPGPKAWARQR